MDSFQCPLEEYKSLNSRGKLFISKKFFASLATLFSAP